MGEEAFGEVRRLRAERERLRGLLKRASDIVRVDVRCDVEAEWLSDVDAELKETP